jgi:hypothetical protein
VLIGSIGRIAGWLGAIACIACCLSGCTPQTDIVNGVAPPAQPGTFFVAKPGAEGVYTEMSGTILELDCSDMEAEVDGKHMLFERKVVRRVTVSDASSSIGKKAAYCWNQEESAVLPLLKSLDNFPVIGPFLVAVVENLNSPHVQTILGIVILLAGLVLVAYRVYDYFYVAGSERNLNLDKLNLEVRKLRYELDAVEKQMGVQLPIRHDPEGGSPIQDRVRARLELPKLHIRDFVKYKILRLLTEQQKSKRHDQWITIWQATREDPKGSPLRYFLTMAAYGIGVIAATLLASAFFLGVLLSLFDSTLGDSFGVICLVLTLVFLSVLLRLVANRRIVRDSYREIYHAPR